MKGQWARAAPALHTCRSRAAHACSVKRALVLVIDLGVQQTKCIFHFHYRLIIVVDCNKVATAVVLCTCPFTPIILKMNRPIHNLMCYNTCNILLGYLYFYSST